VGGSGSRTRRDIRPNPRGVKRDENRVNVGWADRSDRRQPAQSGQIPHAITMIGRTTAIGDINGYSAALGTLLAAIRASPDVPSPCPLVEPQGITGDQGHRAEVPMPPWTGWGLARGRGSQRAPCGRPGHNPSLQVPRHQADSFP